MRLAVFGANGPTGRLLCRLALDEHHDVVAFTRHPDTFPFEDPRLDVWRRRRSRRGRRRRRDRGHRRGRIDPRSAVRQDADQRVLGRYHQHHRRHAGGRHQAVRRASPPARSAPHPEPLGGFVFEKIMQPYVVNKLGKTVYDDMRRMESIVSASDLAWTIVRPSGLFEASGVSEYSIAIDHIGYRFTARIDLADCLLRQASATRTYARRSRSRRRAPSRRC